MSLEKASIPLFFPTLPASLFPQSRPLQPRNEDRGRVQRDDPDAVGSIMQNRPRGEAAGTQASRREAGDVPRSSYTVRFLAAVPPPCTRRATRTNFRRVHIPFSVNLVKTTQRA